jgi:hypothetical protein
MSITMVVEVGTRKFKRDFVYLKYKFKKIKNMKITSKTLMVGFNTEVKLGNNDAIELTLINQAWISESKDGGICVDLEIGIDIVNVKFLGIDIDSGYNSYKQFKASLKDLGINLDELIDEKEKELANSGIEDKLKLMFKSKF